MIFFLKENYFIKTELEHYDEYNFISAIQCRDYYRLNIKLIKKLLSLPNVT